MAALVEVAEWPAYTSVPVPGNAATLLDAASGLIRAHCGWSISAETVTGQVIDGDGSTLLMLPTLHLTAVTAVSVAGVELAAGRYEWSAAGVLSRVDGWPHAFRSVTVSYRHGYDPVPAEVKALCVAVAARHASASAPIKSETIGGYSYTLATATPGTLALEPVERLVLARYTLPGRP